MRAGGLLRLCALWAGVLRASDRARAEDVDAASPFKDRQLRILGAMQRPWDLRPFYASSIGAGSFVPLSQPFLGAMGPQHPADELHPASDDGRPSPFRTIMVAAWELRRNGAGQPIAAPADTPRRVPLVRRVHVAWYVVEKPPRPMRLASTSASSEICAGCARSRSCLLYTSPSPRDRQKSRMPSSA